jgi:hypothetical protein
VSLKGRGHFVHQKSSPKLAKNFHEHDRADVLDAFGGVFGNGDKPFPFPGSWDVTVLPHGGEALIGFCDHLRLPVLEVFVLEARWAAGGVPLFRFDESGKFLQRGRLIKERMQIGKHRITGRGVVKCTPEGKERIRASCDWNGKARVEMSKLIEGHGLERVPGHSAIV